jgi:hypothetical protein
MERPPLFSFVLLVYNMQREAPRTLFTLSAEYLSWADRVPYEVIVIENGSSLPLDQAAVEAVDERFRYIFHETSSPSPVEAMHLAVTRARGEYVVIMNDGARMLSPGILEYLTRAVQAFENPVIAVPGYHLGPTVQSVSMMQGYDQQAEDRLLEEVPWREDGYRLLDIASLAGSSLHGWFEPLSESNCVALSRATYDAIGGICQDFLSPGGGLIALDFFKIAWECPDAEPVMLLGEGTFHQFHGGVTTNSSGEEHQRRVEKMHDEYERIRGKKFVAPTRAPHYLGHLPSSASRFARYSAEQFARSNPTAAIPGMLAPEPEPEAEPEPAPEAEVEAAPGRSFAQRIWSRLFGDGPRTPPPG